MKLRNKKTGKIVELETYCILGKSYERLTDINKNWEDYEDQKDIYYWYIDDLGRIQLSSKELDEISDRPNNWLIRKAIGNYFETEEEAEFAVRKVKAWKRLKDKGFRFLGNNIFFIDGINSDSKKEIEKDLDLLFWS